MSGKCISKLLTGCYAILLLLMLLQDASPADQLAVFVSILPQKYFVQQIGGKRVSVQVMVKPGANPATYEPKPAQMTALAKTSLYFSIGVPFENVWLKKIAAANPGMRVIPTDHEILKFTMDTHHHFDGRERSEDRTEGHQGIQDPHIWTSPPLVMIQARSILIALQTYDASNSAFYESNYRRFINDLVDLDAEIRKILADKYGSSFLVFHPSWGYFARAYGLQQVAIEIEGKDPKPADLQKLISYARKKNISAVFVQPQFSSKSAEIIARAIGARVLPADPLAADWAANLRNQALQLEAAAR